MEGWGAFWLNPSRHLVLVKSVLSFLPIFQFSSLFDPMGFKKVLARDIRQSLWKGGKSNTKIFHLENWNLVRAPNDHGGLGVRDPKIVNLALGEKFFGGWYQGKMNGGKKH
jgi:hypothetical protein